jgi:hypothetical protein
VHVAHNVQIGDRTMDRGSGGYRRFFGCWHGDRALICPAVSICSFSLGGL